MGGDLLCLPHHFTVRLKLHDSHLGETVKPPLVNYFDNNKEMEGKRSWDQRKLLFS